MQRDTHDAGALTYVFQTELPVFAFNLLRQRHNSGPIVNTEQIRREVLDAYADALLRLFSEPPLLGSASQLGGEETVAQVSGGYGLRIKEELSAGGTARITFFQIRPMLVPIGLDLVSLALAIFSSPATAVLPAADAIYNFAKALIQLDRDKGDGDLIDAYQAFLAVKADLLTQKNNASPTAEQILTLLPGWSASTLTNTLAMLEAKKIIVRRHLSDSHAELTTPWQEVF